MLFTETQHLRPLWLNLLLLVSWLVGLVSMLATGAAILPMLLYSGVFLTVFLFIYLLYFRVEVNPDGILFHFPPFVRNKHISFEQIISLKFHPINPIFDYGGWGYRLMPFFDGTAYIMEGKQGATIVFQGGKRKIAFTLKDVEGFKNGLAQSNFDKTKIID